MTTREEIAIFAAWCVGSCRGDHDSRVEAERELVMQHEDAFNWWAAEHARFLDSRRSRRSVFMGKLRNADA
jgi:hypothetical protein